MSLPNMTAGSAADAAWVEAVIRQAGRFMTARKAHAFLTKKIAEAIEGDGAGRLALLLDTPFSIGYFPPVPLRLADDKKEVSSALYLAAQAGASQSIVTLLDRAGIPSSGEGRMQMAPYVVHAVDRLIKQGDAALVGRALGSRAYKGLENSPEGLLDLRARIFATNNPAMVRAAAAALPALLDVVDNPSKLREPLVRAMLSDVTPAVFDAVYALRKPRMTAGDYKSALENALFHRNNHAALRIAGDPANGFDLYKDAEMLAYAVSQDNTEVAAALLDRPAYRRKLPGAVPGLLVKAAGQQQHDMVEMMLRCLPLTDKMVRDAWGKTPIATRTSDMLQAYLGDPLRVHAREEKRLKDIVAAAAKGVAAATVAPEPAAFRRRVKVSP